MYVLQHKGRVLVGPMEWNRGMFEGALEKIGEYPPLPRGYPGVSPFVIDAVEDISIFEAEYQYPPHNPKIEWLNGPFWTYTETKAIGGWEVHDQNIDMVKYKLKQDTAAERYRREIAGVKMTMQDKEISVETDRDIRNVFMQKLIMMGDAEIANWKFPEGWLSLTKAELLTIIGTGAAHIQGQFDWEVAKGVEIDACVTLAELDAIEIVPPVEEPTGPPMP